MEFPEDLRIEIANQSETEFNNPTPDFGERLFDLIMTETGKALTDELIFEFNTWVDQWLDPQLTWGDFIRWVWRKLKEWWDSLWKK